MRSGHPKAHGERPLFDLSTSKMFLVLLIALLVVGPKELPGLLRTIGRYVGMIKRQAAEFRAQFDDAMRESELADLKKQVEDFGKDAQSAVHDAEAVFRKEAEDIKSDATSALDHASTTMKGDSAIERADLPALPIGESGGTSSADAALAAALDAASPPAEPIAEAKPVPQAAEAKPAPAPEKVGA